MFTEQRASNYAAWATGSSVFDASTLQIKGGTGQHKMDAVFGTSWK